MRTTSERFWEKVDHASDHPDSCWTWLASTNRAGYGMFKIDGRPIGAHRAAWELTFGRVPDGKSVLHHCDNPACVRPEHLFVGDASDNMRDSQLKGRRSVHGPGSMRRLQDNTWELRVSLGRDPITGKRRTTSRTHHGGQRTAQAELATFAVEMRDSNRRGTGTTFGRLLGEYLTQIAGELSPSTLRGYRRRVERRIIPALGQFPLRKLTARDLDRYYRALEEQHSPSDVRQDHAIIRGALNQAVDWGYVPTNIAVRARPPRPPRSEIAAPPPPEVILALIAGAEAGTGHRNSRPNPELGLLIRLAAATGARRGELCGLTIGDVDVEGPTLTIRRNVVEVDRDLVVKDTKTHQVRRVSVDPATAHHLADHLAGIRTLAAELGVEPSPGWFLFARHPGGPPWRPEYVTLAFGRLCARLGAKVRFHDLRHAHATYLLVAGVDVRTVAGRLGHENPATTLKVYGHFLEAPDRAAAGIVGQLLAGSD